MLGRNRRHLCRQLALWLSLYPVGLIVISVPTSLHAQQTLFNVPSGTITEAEEVFLQEQLNFGRFGESNLTIDYGIGNNIEIGLNIFKVNLYPGNVIPQPGESNDSAFLFNVQKVVDFDEEWSIELGTQNGLSANNARQQVDYLNFTWASARYEPEHIEGIYIAGIYAGNPPYLGTGSAAGLMLGVEYPLIRDRFSLVADALAGSNDSSVVVVGGQYTLSQRLGWQISLGAQLPFPGSKNDYGVVVELTKFPKSFFGDSFRGSGER